MSFIYAIKFTNRFFAMVRYCRPFDIPNVINYQARIKQIFRNAITPSPNCNMSEVLIIDQLCNNIFFLCSQPASSVFHQLKTSYRSLFSDTVTKRHAPFHKVVTEVIVVLDISLSYFFVIRLQTTVFPGFKPGCYLRTIHPLLNEFPVFYAFDVYSRAKPIKHINLFGYQSRQ